MVFGEPSAQGLSCPGLARLLGEPGQIFTMSARDAVQVEQALQVGRLEARTAELDPAEL